MTQINLAAKAAQEQARRQNGEFGTQQHSAPESTSGSESTSLCKMCRGTPAVRLGHCGGCLEAAEEKFSSSPVRVGGTSPWGRIQQAALIAPGITDVSTARHGGVKLSAPRNREVPAPLRRQSGWYEEDLDMAIAARTFPNEFGSGDPDRTRDEADALIRNFLPDEWEAATGRSLEPGQSTTRDKQLREQRYCDLFTNRFAASVPDEFAAEADGMVLVGAKRDADSQTRTYAVPRSEYDRAERGTFVIDPERHQQWSVLEEPEAPGEIDGDDDAQEAANQAYRAKSSLEMKMRREPNLSKKMAMRKDLKAAEATFIKADEESCKARRARTERVNAAGPIPAREEFAAEMAQASERLQAEGGWGSASMPSRDRYEQLFWLGKSAHLFERIDRD